jgi:hypothetical protein
MSIAEFTATLKNKAADAAAKQAASNIIGRLATFSTKLYTSGKADQKAASIINEDSRALRKVAEAQGRTRLVVTEDNLSGMLGSFGLNVSEKEAIAKYLEFLDSTYGDKYKVKHFEFYTDTGDILPGVKLNTSLSQFIKSTDTKNIIAVRGLNFSHNNTLRHMAMFLKFATTTTLSIQELESAITTLYDRGHIEATTTGRQLASIGGISKDMDVLDKIVQLSRDLDIASSSMASSKYSKIVASLSKDFNGPRMYANLEYQLKRSDDGKGNQDSADITRGLRIISTLSNLIANVKLSSRGALLSQPVGESLGVAAIEFGKLAAKLDKQKDAIVRVLTGYIENPEQYLADLQSSDSMKDHTLNVLQAALTGTRPRTTRTNLKNVEVFSTSSSGMSKTNTTASITKLVNETKKELVKAKALASSSFKKSTAVERQSVNLPSLLAVLNSQIHDRVAKSMGTGSSTNILNYRSGRFAESTKVERLSLSRNGMISAYYSYMKNPYATFSQGGRQSEPVSRDPKLLISKSIREIAATQVSNRMRAILV